MVYCRATTTATFDLFSRNFMVDAAPRLNENCFLLPVVHLGVLDRESDPAIRPLYMIEMQVSGVCRMAW